VRVQLVERFSGGGRRQALAFFILRAYSSADPAWRCFT